MKHYLLKTFSFLTLLVAASIPNISANTISQTEDIVHQETPVALAEQPSNNENALVAQQNQQELNQAIEKLKKNILMLARELDFTAETIAMHISSGNITVTDKDTTFKNILSFRQLLSTTQREIMVSYDITLLTNALNILRSLQEHIKNIVDNNIKAFPEVNVDTLIKRSVSSTSIEEMHTDIANLSQELTVIKKDAEQAGISFFNKGYRKIVGGPVDWIAKHNAHGKAAICLTTTAALIYFWYRVTSSDIVPEGNRNWYQKAYATMRHYLGRYQINPTEELHGTPFQVNIQPGCLTGIDALINQYTVGGLGLGSALFGPKLKELYAENITPITNVITNTAYDIHCRFKGGIYHAQNKTRSHEKFLINPRFTFKDIVGYENLKIIGKELVEYIDDPEKFQNIGLTPEKGILLYGPPGTGKSFFAEALCGEVKAALKRNGRSENEFKFFNIKLSEIEEYGIDKILEWCNTCAPCIMFIDEIDLLGLQRDRNPKRLYDFLTGLSGFLNEKDPKKQVIIIGATNKRENLDISLTRAGRLNKEVFLDYPTMEYRYQYLVKALENRINPSLFDLKHIAMKTGDYTIEDLNKIINNALYKTRITGRALIQKDLDDVINNDLRKIAMHQEIDLPMQEQGILAVHMAGHTLARILFPTEQVMDIVTIKPVIEKAREQAVWQQYFKNQSPGQIYGKIFTYIPHDSLGNATKQSRINECKILLAGRIAEHVLLGTTSCNNSRTCSGTCKPIAFNIAKEIVLDGLVEEQLSKKRQAEVIEQAMQLIATFEKEITGIFEKQKTLITIFADMLIQQKTISQHDIFELLEMIEKNPEILKNIEEAQQKLIEKAKNEALAAQA